MPAVFVTLDPDFADLLRAESSGPNDDAFVARNFLLDEYVSKDRAESYLAGLLDPLPWSAGQWGDCHQRNLVKEVGFGTVGNPNDPTTWPRTFQEPRQVHELAHGDSRLLLIHVVEVGSLVTRLRGTSPPTLIDLGNASLAGDRSAGRLLQAHLNRWYRTTDQRPVFAAIWERVSHLFGRKDWPDNLRDELGLAFIDPGTRRTSIPIFVFRYPIRRARTINPASDTRPIAIPTVLDGRWYPAFCPVPTESLEGHPVNLAANPSGFGELLHLRTEPHVQDLYAVGQVTEPVEPLGNARAAHLQWIQAAYRRNDFGTNTDADLL